LGQERSTRRATIRDVAESAGVSVGTASKALNGQGKLRAETIERVMRAAERLGRGSQSDRHPGHSS